MSEMPAATSAQSNAPSRAEDLLGKMRAIFPTIAGNWKLADIERRVPDENVRLLRAAGFTEALLPAKFGGLELSAEEYGECLLELATTCSATAWAIGLLVQHSHAVALMSPQLQEDVWGADQTALISSSVAPVGKVVEVKGGVRLSGTYGFSSGSDHATWLFVGFLRMPNPALPPEYHFAVLPRSDYDLLDDWHTAGMRGTGSRSAVLNDVFVPEHRIDSYLALNSGASKGFGTHPAATYYSAFAPYFAFGFSVTAVGGARRIVQLYRDKVATRLRAYTGGKVADSAPAYMRLAESTQQIDAALAMLRQDWKQITNLANRRTLPAEDDLIRWRSNQSYVTKLAIEAADRLMVGSGGSAWRLSNEMQQIWRNVRMTGAHAYTDYDVAAQVYGRYLLGLQPDQTLL